MAPAAFSSSPAPIFPLAWAGPEFAECAVLHVFVFWRRARYLANHQATNKKEFFHCRAVFELASEARIRLKAGPPGVRQPVDGLVPSLPRPALHGSSAGKHCGQETDLREPVLAWRQGGGAVTNPYYVAYNYIMRVLFGSLLHSSKTISPAPRWGWPRFLSGCRGSRSFRCGAWTSGS